MKLNALFNDRSKRRETKRDTDISRCAVAVHEGGRDFC